MRCCRWRFSFVFVSGDQCRCVVVPHRVHEVVVAAEMVRRRGAVTVTTKLHSFRTDTDMAIISARRCWLFSDPQRSLPPALASAPHGSKKQSRR